MPFLITLMFCFSNYRKLLISSHKDKHSFSKNLKTDYVMYMDKYIITFMPNNEKCKLNFSGVGTVPKKKKFYYLNVIAAF